MRGEGDFVRNNIFLLLNLENDNTQKKQITTTSQTMPRHKRHGSSSSSSSSSSKCHRRKKQHRSKKNKSCPTCRAARNVSAQAVGKTVTVVGTDIQPGATITVALATTGHPSVTNVASFVLNATDNPTVFTATLPGVGSTLLVGGTVEFRNPLCGPLSIPLLTAE